MRLTLSLAKAHQGLVPARRSVTRGSKTFTETYWVRPGEAAPTSRRPAPVAHAAPRHVFRSEDQKREEFGQLYAEHEADLGRMARFRFGYQPRGDRDAEDLLQDAMVQGYQHFEQFEPGTNFPAWCYAIMRNWQAGSYRKEQRRQGKAPSVSLDAGADLADLVEFDSRLATDPEGLANQVLEQLDREEVRAVMGQLPDDERVVVGLRYGDNDSRSEIARALGLSVRRVSRHLAAAQERLQVLLRPYMAREHPQVLAHFDSVQAQKRAAAAAAAAKASGKRGRPMVSAEATAVQVETAQQEVERAMAAYTKTKTAERASVGEERQRNHELRAHAARILNRSRYELRRLQQRLEARRLEKALGVEEDRFETAFWRALGAKMREAADEVDTGKVFHRIKHRLRSL